MTARYKKPGLGPFHMTRPSPEQDRKRKDAAFAAIRKLYRESLPLWQVCPRGYCRRHRTCAGDADCLKRGWPRLPEALQMAAIEEVKRGGPRRLPPATEDELHLRRYPPSNFVL